MTMANTIQNSKAHLPQSIIQDNNIISILGDFEKIKKPEKEIRAEAKDFIMQIYGMKALNLRDQIVEEFQSTRKDLEECLTKIKLHKSFLNSLEETIRLNTSLNHMNLNQLGLLELKKMSLIAATKTILERVANHEVRLKQLEESWDYFRTDYKGKVIQTLKDETKKHVDAKDDFRLDWNFFLPDSIKEHIKDSTVFKDYMI